MNILESCEQVQALLEPYTEGALEPPEGRALDAHVRTCSACRERLRRCQAVRGFLRSALGPGALKEGFMEETGRRLRSVAPPTTSYAALISVTGQDDTKGAVQEASWLARLGAAPWWAVSAILHILVIVLLGLITMSIGRGENGAAVVVLTNLEKRTVKTLEEESRPKANLRDLLESKHETPPTDSSAQVASNLVVPPEILAKAELGEHFETLNLDRPDTQSAFGNPEARLFHSASGNDEPEGGGGLGGTGLMDDLIGAGGSASPGSGGGWGGGHGTGTGVGNGAGHGSFGQRGGGGRKLMVLKHGGSKVTESAVEKGLEWLARNQEPEGHWDAKKHGSKTYKCDVAMTGFALLAFLGAGHTEKVGKYRENVKKAVEWLGKQQGADGNLAPGRGSTVGYEHSIAGIALAEAAGMGRVGATRQIAQKAVNYSVDIHQAGEGSEKRGWRYQAKSEGDLSHSGWFIMQLKATKVAGLSVPHGGFEGAKWFLDHVQDKTLLQRYPDHKVDDYDTGQHRYGYTEPGSHYRTTSVGILCRQFMGTPIEELQSGVTWFLTKGGRGYPARGKEDLYYWYYGTLCTFQQGGEVWKQWNEALKGALLPAQRAGGVEDGSWDPAGEYGEEWGRVGQTALSCLCLEVYYRYLPMYR